MSAQRPPTPFDWQLVFRKCRSLLNLTDVYRRPRPAERADWSNTVLLNAGLLTADKNSIYDISHLTAQSLWTIMISLHLFHYDRSSVTEIENHKLSVKVYQPKEKQIYVWCVCRHNRKRNLYLFISSILNDTPFIQCVHVIYTAKMYLQ